MRNQHNQVNELERILLISSGASLSILLDERCKKSRNIYAKIGIVTILTSIISALSGGYAGYRACEASICSKFSREYTIVNASQDSSTTAASNSPKESSTTVVSKASVGSSTSDIKDYNVKKSSCNSDQSCYILGFIIGILSGSLVYSINRLVISSSPKTIDPNSISKVQSELENYGVNVNNRQSKSEKEDSFIKIIKSLYKNELFQSSPRIILSIALGFVVSKPIEYFLFNNAILKEHRDESKVDINSHIDALIKKRMKIQNDRVGTEKEIRELLGCEKSIQKDNNNYNKTDAMNTCNKRNKDLQLQLTEQKDELLTLQAEINDCESITVNCLSPYIDIPTQHSTLEKLTKEDMELKLFNWAITLLFIVIDLLPLISKLLKPIDIYDLLVWQNTQKALSNICIELNNNTELADEKFRRASRQKEKELNNLIESKDKELNNLIESKDKELKQLEQKIIQKKIDLEEQLNGNLLKLSKDVTEGIDNHIKSSILKAVKKGSESDMERLAEEIVKTKVRGLSQMSKNHRSNSRNGV